MTAQSFPSSAQDPTLGTSVAHGQVQVFGLDVLDYVILVSVGGPTLSARPRFVHHHHLTQDGYVKCVFQF